MGKEVDKSMDSSKKTVDEIIEKTAEKIEAAEDAFDGPAERAGKEIDEALDDAAEKIEEAGDTLKEKADAANSDYK